MEIFWFIVVFIVGASVGSFLNVVIDRLPHGQSLIRPPSHCPACQQKLAGKDLIPLVSYIWLRGKCRYCGGHIPLRVLLVELVTGLLFVLLMGIYGVSLESVIIAVYSCAFIAITVIDFEHGIIPNSITYPFIIFAILITTLLGSKVTGSNFSIDYFDWRITLPLLANFVDAMIGGLLAFFLLLLVVLISRGGMGLGDVKLAAMIGFMTAFPMVIVSLFVSIITGGIIAAILLASGRRKKKDTVPFGPFLCLGAFVALLWGNAILSWYLGY